jgi:hypothetical protein
VPFASPNALFNLSKLSVWWLRLGIAIERIKPGHPQQNGRHERMHFTLKKEITRPPGPNSLQQQERFDAFVREFNDERPREALEMKCPAEFYLASPRPYEMACPNSSIRSTIARLLSPLAAATACTQADQHLYRAGGPETRDQEIEDGIWLVSFMHYDPGYFDLEEKTLQPLDNPFGAQLSPMSPAGKTTRCATRRRSRRDPRAP